MPVFCDEKYSMMYAKFYDSDSHLDRTQLLCTAVKEIHLYRQQNFTHVERKEPGI